MTNYLRKMAGILSLCTWMAAAVPGAAYADVNKSASAAAGPGAEAVEAAEDEEEAAAEAGSDSAGDAEASSEKAEAAAADSEESEAGAAEDGSEYQTSSEMLIKVEDTDADLYALPDEEAEVVGQAEAGSTYTVLEMVDGEWVKVSNGDSEGYINTVSSAAIVAENAEEVVVSASEKRRQDIVAYALQFVGNRYVYGGRDPHTGVDCSGFTSYIMRHAAGVELAHSSRAQAGQGRAVSTAEIRPGDIVCYASGRTVNHVGLYIGDGKIVHASNERNGILISDWTYRTPYRIVNVLGD